MKIFDPTTDRFPKFSIRYRKGDCVNRVAQKILAKMRNNEGSVLYLLLVLILCAEVCMTSARHLIKKRNYSDQSVRGYLAEIR
ncbi:hypothetical protein E2986_11680 [Frieseomelitta varia]|uniref:Uncharacterized protein n=1 Tax=Frieseomelitta varia TaxID=561572 RepID=A0A833SE40_9HYME|nr:hypothetical protein E2986_11680 [Frieseomelitta varia]